MIVLRNDRRDVTITFLNAPFRHYPLTRIVVGPHPQRPLHFDVDGDSEADRDREMDALVGPTAFVPGWRRVL